MSEGGREGGKVERGRRGELRVGKKQKEGRGLTEKEVRV